MILYPDLYVKNITKIDLKVLNENDIKGLILDVDNTIIDYEKNILRGTKQWCDKLKQNNIRLCILSNSNNKQKVESVAQILEIPYIFFAKKPLKCGFKKAQKLLNIENEKIRCCRRPNYN